MVRLLLADDQELIRSALAVMLGLEDDFEVVAEVGRGDEVVQAARQHRPDVALLDIDMPGIDGIAAAGVLAQEVPECRALILTTFGRPGYLRRAMESGAYGFVVKDAPAQQLADAIRRRDLLNVEIVQLQSEVKALSKTLITDALITRKKEIEEVVVGLSEMIRSVLRLTAEPMTAADMKRMLTVFGFDFSRLSNPSAAVHSTLKRMAATGELILDANSKYRLADFRY